MNKLMTTGLLCTMMGLSMMPAHAQETPTTTASITKTFLVPEGVSSVDQTFQFSATPTNGGPKATVGDISFKDLGTAKDGQYTLTDTAKITFGTFPHAGMYTYDVTETQGTDTHITYSSDTYLMRVYVVNGDQGLAVKQITAEKGGKKQDKMNFTNSYAAKSDLTISKQVVGDYGDRTKDFSFTIRFTKGALTNQETYTTSDGETVQAGKDYTFTLKHGQSLTFKDLPVGTKYTVTEASNADYKIEVSLNGQTSETNTATATVNDTKNTVAFTNTANQIVVTGVIMKSLPYIGLVALGVLGFAGLFFMKKRKMQH